MTKKLITLILAAAPIFATTPAETAIAKAQHEIAKHPDYVQNYNALAMAYARRARETSDTNFYTQAEETLKKSFALAADNYEALKTQTWLLLGRHEFAKARELAMKLNKRTPDDSTVYGYLADANAELGNYNEAVDAVQWMLNLRPGNVPGLTRAAYLRELHGDFDGAIEMMQQAFDSTPYHESEDRAWLLTQIAHLNLAAGHNTEAAEYAIGALGVFPDYHYALGTLAQIRMAQGRYDEAVDLFQKRYTAAPHAENLFSVGEALEHAGRHGEAAKTFAQFEQMALKEANIADNSNHELVSYYIDYARQPEKALRIAKSELERRHDAYTLDAYAWALAAAGDAQHANIEIQKALAWGLRDAKVLEHAHAIAIRSLP